MKQVVKIVRNEPVGVIKAKRAAHLGHVRRRKGNHRLTWAAQKQKELDMLSFWSVTNDLSIADILSKSIKPTGHDEHDHGPQPGSP